jgi:hypothetical protein
MICKDCRDAGDLLVKLRSWPKPQNLEEAVEAIMSSSIIDRVKILHAKCKGSSWCDCQHETINPIAIKEEVGVSG